MPPAMLFGTAGDHIEVVIGLLLGFLLVLWALITLVQWLKTTPWKRSEPPAEEVQTAGKVMDESDPSRDIRNHLPRFAVRYSK